MGVEDIIDVEYSIEVLEPSLLNVLQHSVATGVPDCEVDEEMAVDPYFLEPELESIGRGNVI